MVIVGGLLMTKLLINMIKSKYDVSSSLGREKVGTMSGWCGIICNAFLCIVKFIIGTVSGSVSITADAFNNLSDAGSNVVTIAGLNLPISLWIRNILSVTAGLNIYPL